MTALGTAVAIKPLNPFAERGLQESTHRDQRPRRGHRRRAAARPPDAGLRTGRLRQDAVGDGVPGPRHHASSTSRACSWRSRRSADDLIANVASLGFDLAAARGRRPARHRPRRRSTPARSSETGDWDLDGLFIRLGAAIDAVGAKRVVIDTIESAVRRVRRTRRSCARSCGGCSAGSRTAGVTAVITGERGDGTLTRHGIEEYVSDCVIVLDHRVHRADLDPAAAHPQVPRLAARHQRVPVPDRRARHLGAADHLARPAARRVRRAGVDRASPRLDAMLGGGGLLSRAARCWSAAPPAPASRRWRRSSATPPARAASGRCTSPSRSPQAQIVRNMASVGIDLAPLGRCRAAAVPVLPARACSASRRTCRDAEDVVASSIRLSSSMDPISDLLACREPATMSPRC